jgi:deferrochelatase/peroxidase EfeB
MAGSREGRALNVAISHAGLARLGVPEEALAGFSLEFAGGMVTPTRSAFLGDVGAQAPATWAWGGPDNPRVDVLLLLYARSAADLIAHADSVRHRFPADGVREVVELPTTPLSPRDHLGFADGISQPEVTGLHGRGERGVALASSSSVPERLRPARRRPAPPGRGCPVAAHVRRANPRDSLDPRPGSAALVRVNDRHRLIRRGRQYGPLPASRDAAPGTLAASCVPIRRRCINPSPARLFPVGAALGPAVR